MTEDIQAAVTILRKGGIILYPTDTIWGLGCDATNSHAVKEIYHIKQRTDVKSMLVLVDAPEKLEEYVEEVPEIAWNILEVADKPLTIIYPGARNLAPELVAGDGSIGIRLVNDEFCRRLIQKFGKPIVSTSANISGKPFPSGFSEIDPGIIASVNYVVKHKQDLPYRGKPSGIIKLGLHGEVQVIRE
ncbi:MAG: threonylcarbamoyl-AMP synthase [Bacteroidales bacterium]|nr:threonylcarbamoyl-AMP synthase [Bacteroidales bacterium]